MKWPFSKPVTIVTLVVFFLVLLVVLSQGMLGILVKTFRELPRLSTRSTSLAHVTLGDEEPIQTADLKYVPDGHLAKITENNTVRVFLSALDKSYMLEGTSLSDLRLVQDQSGQPLVVLEPSGSEGERDYAALGSVVKNPQTGDLIGIYHTEVRINPDASDTQATEIAVAYSQDGGRTWNKKGVILTGMNELPIGQHVSGAGQPCAIIVGDYIYVYYVDWNNETHTAIHLARSALSDNGMPGTWKKRTAAGFTTEGIGGKSDPVIAPSRTESLASYTALPSISYNTHLKRYLAVFEKRTGFFTATSRDGIEWTNMKEFFAFPKDTTLQKENGDIWYSYPTYLSDSTLSDTITGKTGYLYYSRGIFGDTHYMVRRTFSLQ
jgi:hypothetical protein